MLAPISTPRFSAAITPSHTTRERRCRCRRDGTAAVRKRVSQAPYAESHPLTRAGRCRSHQSPTGSEMRSMTGLRIVVSSETPTTIWYIGFDRSPVQVM